MRIYLFLIALLVISIWGCADKYLNVVKKSDFISEWQFTEKNKNLWNKATVPGVVQSDLFHAGIIQDPLFESNEVQLQWIGLTDWNYKAVFQVDDSLLKFKSIDFVFEGLDTYAKVFVNDSLLLTADNMFREWRANAKRFLRKGRILYVSISFLPHFEVS
ncbi:MAG: hypothetical protein IPP71_04165 [Bacteroidetes bacterium]|nr:hypothetical protein [Bacteroidota bacterium]